MKSRFHILWSKEYNETINSVFSVQHLQKKEKKNQINIDVQCLKVSGTL